LSHELSTHEKRSPYVWSDAWLLLSIVLAASAESDSLARMVSIEMGSIAPFLRFKCWTAGFARLHAGGFVRLQGESVFPSASAMQLYERVSRRGGQSADADDRDCYRKPQ